MRTIDVLRLSRNEASLGGLQIVAGLKMLGDQGRRCNSEQG